MFLTTVLASGTASGSTLASVEPGALGFIVVAALGVALYFLIKSMNKQFKKLGPPPEKAGEGVFAEAAKQPESAAKSD